MFQALTGSMKQATAALKQRQQPAALANIIELSLVMFQLHITITEMAGWLYFRPKLSKTVVPASGLAAALLDSQAAVSAAASGGDVQAARHGSGRPQDRLAVLQMRLQSTISWLAFHLTTYGGHWLGTNWAFFVWDDVRQQLRASAELKCMFALHLALCVRAQH